MGLSAGSLFERFSPAADLTIIAVCSVMALLMLFSYVSRGRSLRIFLSIVVTLVAAALADERAWQLLESLASTFTEMGYSVLFEGVEDDSDEQRCRGMSASYLQGYKYSRPVPIEKLAAFFPSAG